MTDLPVAPGAPAPPPTAGREGGRPGRRTLLRIAGTPLALGLVLLALHLWIASRTLGSVEARRLTPEVLGPQILRHLELTVLSTALVVALAVPAGVLATRRATRRAAGGLVGLGNAAQAVPSLGLLALVAYLFREVEALPATGRLPVVVALAAWAFLPVLRNTVIGLGRVDEAVLEAGRGTGMSDWLVLRRLELPLAVPVILAGVRTALVLNVGTATLAFLFGGGGLGALIFQGFQLGRTTLLVTGAVLVSALALLLDHLAHLLQRR